MCEICEEEKYTLNGGRNYDRYGRPSPVGSHYKFGAQTPWRADMIEDRINRLSRKIQRIRKNSYEPKYRKF